MPPGTSLRFTSSRFDHASELPAEYNAGNRFYGRDVALWLAEALTARGLPADFMDEDWGWLVFSRRETTRDFEAAVYYLGEADGDSASDSDDWGLWLRAHERGKQFGLLPRRVEVPVPGDVDAAVRAAIASIGATPMPWDDGDSGGR